MFDFDTFDEGMSKIDDMDTPIHCVHLKFDKRTVLATSHYHKYIEVLYCVDCKMNAIVGSTNYRLNSGDLLIITSNSVHAIYGIMPYNDYYVIRFVPDMLYVGASQQAFGSIYISPLLQDSSEYKKHFTAHDLIDSNIPNIIRSMMKIWDNHSYAWEISIHEKLLTFYLWLLDKWQINITPQATNNQIFSANLTKALNTSIRYIQMNYNNITANSVATKYNFNYSYFLNMFKKYTGTNFNEYVMNLKIQNATNLLLTTSMSITDIAYQTGFSSASHFIYEFKKQKLLTPFKYRKMSSKISDTSHAVIPSHKDRFKD